PPRTPRATTIATRRPSRVCLFRTDLLRIVPRIERHEATGIVRLAGDPDLVVDVGPGAPSRAADLGDELVARDRVAFLHEDPLAVAVVRLVASAVIDHEESPHVARALEVDVRDHP